MAVLYISPVVANPPRVRAGGSVLISSEERNAAGTLATAGTSTKINLIGPDGVEALAATSMTADATGKHSYNFATTTAMKCGWYTAEIVTVDSAIPSNVRCAWLFCIYNEE